MEKWTCPLSALPLPPPSPRSHSTLGCMQIFALIFLRTRSLLHHFFSTCRSKKRLPPFQLTRKTVLGNCFSLYFFSRNEISSLELRSAIFPSLLFSSVMLVFPNILRESLGDLHGSVALKSVTCRGEFVGIVGEATSVALSFHSSRIVSTAWSDSSGRILRTEN